MKLTLTLIIDDTAKGEELGFAIRKAAKEASAFCERTLVRDGYIPVDNPYHLIDSEISVKCLKGADIVRDY